MRRQAVVEAIYQFGQQRRHCREKSGQPLGTLTFSFYLMAIGMATGSLMNKMTGPTKECLERYLPNITAFTVLRIGFSN